MISKFADFNSIWFVDFEYQQSGSSLPNPVCLVAHELRTGETKKLWKDELGSSCPLLLGRRSLFVTFFSSAELLCYKALGWKLPPNILDLYVEFQLLTNGLRPKESKRDLLSALSHFGLQGETSEHKEQMRSLVLSRTDWSDEERSQILDYCASDVFALAALFDRMQALIDLPRAIFRGAYLQVVANIENNGIPLDQELLSTLNARGSEISALLIKAFDPNGGIFHGTTFRECGFREWLDKRNIRWPTTAHGKLKLDKETFKDMALLHPEVEPLKELRKTLSQLRDTSLTVDKEGRSRTFLSPFGSLTSRNQPSNSKFIFGFAKWFRFLIKPEEGKALAYIDWSQQEFGIAAALSKDPAMIAAYNSGDPYMAFAIQANAAPPNATKATHGEIRARFKQCILAVQYGMGVEALAKRLGISFVEAKTLMRLHKKVYAKFWSWMDKAMDQAMLTSKMTTVFGWSWNISKFAKPTTSRNFPMQANGAEMLRIACLFAHNDGVKICAPIHDALLIESDIHEIEAAVEITQKAMARASEVVLDGFALQSEAKIIRYPERFHEKDAEGIWDVVQKCLNDLPRNTCIRTEQVPSLFRAPALSNQNLLKEKEYERP